MANSSPEEVIVEDVLNSNVDTWSVWKICEKMLKEHGFMEKAKFYSTSECNMQAAVKLFSRVVSMFNEMNITEDEELALPGDNMGDDFQLCKCPSDEEDEEWKEDDNSGQRSRTLIPLDYKKKMVEMAKAHPRWSLRTLQRKGGSMLKRKEQLKKWEKEIARGGNTFHKYEAINNMTFQRFQEARDNYEQVTTSMLREWALNYARELKCDKFIASKPWLEKFKSKHGIRQRKLKKLEGRPNGRCT